MVATAATAAVVPSGAAAKKKPRAKPSHPRTAEMVDEAIKALKEKGGSSLQAIKKYITGTYAIDAEKLSPFIKKYLKSGVVAKKLVQTKGKGASGSFRLGDSAAAAAAVAKRRGRTAVAKKTPAKKITSPAKPNKKVSPKKKILKSVAAKPPKPKAAKKTKVAKKAKKASSAPKRAPAKK